MVGDGAALAARVAGVTAGGRYVLTLPVPPSANRWWRHKLHRGKIPKLDRALTFISREAKQYKEATAVYALSAGVRQPLEGPVAISIWWYRERKAGDLDKRVGVLLDALEGTVYRNDAQIVALLVFRSDADPTRPRVEVVAQAVGRQLGFQLAGG